MRSDRRAQIHTCLWLAALIVVALLGIAAPAAAGSVQRLFEPCQADCGVAVYAGHYVEDSMNDVLLLNPKFPTQWDYRDDSLVALAFSRDWLQFGCCFHIEPELGVGQRFGEQDETEFWGAFFLRYRGFPWDRYLLTSVAVSTGMNYATGTSEIEIDRNDNETGSHWLHFFSPEVTFALPSNPNTELLFRLHHRSGIFGLINGANGGTQYGTVGLRVRF